MLLLASTETILGHQRWRIPSQPSPRWWVSWHLSSPTRPYPTPGGGGGYPAQGFPQQQQGYPQPGYPAQPGYPPQPGYPAAQLGDICSSSFASLFFLQATLHKLVPTHQVSLDTQHQGEDPLDTRPSRDSCKPHWITCGSWAVAFLNSWKIIRTL